MQDVDLFVSAGIRVTDAAVAHRREAARIRLLVAGATTERVRRHLGERACAHERLAGDEPSDVLPRARRRAASLRD